MCAKNEVGVKGSLRSFDRLVEALEELPSIGKKSALRLAFHMVLEDTYKGHKISHAIEEALAHIRPCSRCGGLSEDELCAICSDSLRDATQLCLVQSAKDILIIEESGEYHGRYFVFERLSEERLERLREAVEANGAKEIIFAFPPSIQNDALMLYIEDRLKDLGLEFTKIAQGVPTGVHLENVDLLSLARAISERVKA